MCESQLSINFLLAEQQNEQIYELLKRVDTLEAMMQPETSNKQEGVFGKGDKLSFIYFALHIL